MGTPIYAERILQSLIDEENISVVALYTQPDRAVGRKKALIPPPTKALATLHNIPVFQPLRLRDSEVVKGILEIECDFIVVAAYGQILPKSVLDHAPCINLHASILPKYRGASPIQQAILNSDRETGITAMLMDEGLDTGAILKIKTVHITADEMVDALYEKLTKTAYLLTIEVLKEFCSIVPQPQDNTQSSHCSKITKTDGLIDFDNAQIIYNKYRAYTPWPGIYLKSGLKIIEMRTVETKSKNIPSAVLKINKNSLIIGCATGSIEVFKLQPPSKKIVTALEYLNGRSLKVADKIS